MGHCRFCNKVVLLGDSHAHCERKHADGRRYVRRLTVDAILTGKDLALTRQHTEHLARSSFISLGDYAALMMEAWNEALDQCLADGKFEPHEQQRLRLAADALGLDPSWLKQWGVEEKLLGFKAQQEKKAAEAQRREAVVRTRQQTLGALRRGEFPRYPYRTPPLPFLFGTDQWLLWLFEGVTFHEEKTRRKTVRDSHGFSYHGAYAGHSESRSVEWSQVVRVETGVVALTSKCFYFAGPTRSVRILYPKIVTARRYKDALELVKDGVTARRQVFADLDGNFAHDLLEAIARQGR